MPPGTTLPGMRSKFVLAMFAVFVAVAAVAGITVVVLATRDQHGKPTPEAAVAEYVAALRAADADRLAQVVHPDSDAEAEIASRLQRLGGSALSVTRTTISDTESVSAKFAEISGTLHGTPYQDRVWLETCGESWCLRLGPAKGGVGRPISST